MELLWAKGHVGRVVGESSRERCTDSCKLAVMVSNQRACLSHTLTTTKYGHDRHCGL